MSLFPLKPTHAPVKNYYAALAQFHLHGHDTEGNTRSAFADLLKKCCHPYAWHLVEEYQFKGTAKRRRTVRFVTLGYWGASWISRR
jgi:hypothetical protein